MNTGKYLQYIWHYVSLPFLLKISFIFMHLPPFFPFPLSFLGELFCHGFVLLPALWFFVWFSSPLFCPFSRCFFPMPKFWSLLLSIFYLFSLSPAGRQMGDGLLGTENVMERFSSHPSMRTACSCDISLQIEGERSGVPNGTFLELLYFHDILKSPQRCLSKILI